MPALSDTIKTLRDSASGLEVKENFQTILVQSGRVEGSDEARYVNLLTSLWTDRSKRRVSFVLRILLTQGANEEIITVNDDGSLAHPKKPFGTDLTACSDCSNFVAIFKEMYSSDDLTRAASHCIELLMHLVTCKTRNAVIRLEIAIDKISLQRLLPPGTESAPVNYSFWFQFSNLCNTIENLSIQEAGLALLSDGQSFRAFAVEVIDDPDELNLTGLSILSVQTLMSVGTSGILDLRERLLRVATDATLMSRETHSETKLFSPNVFLNLSSPKDSPRFYESISFVIVFSTLALLSDEVVPGGDGDSWVFRSKIPTETLELRTELRSSGNVTYIKESETTKAAAIPSTKVIASFRKITEEFAESIGLPALSALRKKTIHDLLREHRYAKLTDVLMNPDPLLKYYSHLKQELLSSRLDELGKIFDKMWDTASQVGRDLAEMLETMHEKIEAASMLIFGTLAFQAYLFASQAINASQLFSLLFIFSSGLVFFVLFTQFRISGTSQNAHMAMRTLDSVEQQVIAQTGLENSPQWKEGPVASFKDLETRVDTIETLTWAFLTLNASAISYFAYAMSKTGVNWRIALPANLGLLVTFLLCLAYTRRDVIGLRIFTGRTKLATVLLSLSVIILIANSVLSIVRYWPELSSFLHF